MATPLEHDRSRPCEFGDLRRPLLRVKARDGERVQRSSEASGARPGEICCPTVLAWQGVLWGFWVEATHFEIPRLGSGRFDISCIWGSLRRVLHASGTHA